MSCRSIHVKRLNRFTFPLVLLLLAWQQPSYAQFSIPPHAPWKTIETDHFRVYFPAGLDQWSVRTVSQMESIHDKVSDWVGYSHESGKIDILIMDPMSASNGMALPFLRYPRIVLWATAPDTSSIIGGRSAWEELVFSHEYAHILHLTRPSHNPWQRVFSHLIPLSPIAMKSPAWLVEGYATLMEGLITGYGRPQGSLRAAVIRQWAVEGRLPDYQRVNGSEDWLGYSMPYLVGSSFLEWLQERQSDPECFRNLWRRMTAKTSRSFDEAFSGVFGANPSELYDRFRAEMVFRAMTIENEISGQKRVEGDLWSDSEGIRGPIHISPDGNKIALTLMKSGQPVRLVVWSSTNIKDTSRKKRMASLADPYDVAEKPFRCPERALLAEWKERNGIIPLSPHWFPDNENLLFYSPVQVNEFRYENDLFKWNTKTGFLERLTWHADLKYGCPIGETERILAVRQRDGWNSVVEYDPKTRSERNIAGPRLDEVYGRPDVSRDGRFAVLVASGKNLCELRIYDLQEGDFTKIPAPGQGLYIDPVFSGDDRSVYVANDHDGIFNIIRIDPEEGNLQRVTRMLGGAISPAVDQSEDDRIYFLSVHSKGFSIQKLDVTGIVEDSGVSSNDMKLVLPPRSLADPPEYESRPVNHSADYGWGRKQEFSFVAGSALTPSSQIYELGLRGGDILGRLEYILMGAKGFDGAPEGGMLSLRTERWPVRLGFKAAGYRELLSRQKDAHGNESGWMDRTTRYISVSASKEISRRLYSVFFSAEGFASRVEPEGEIPGYNRSGGLLVAGGGVDLDYADRGMLFQSRGKLAFGVTDGQDWNGMILQSHAGGRWRKAMIHAYLDLGRTQRHAEPQDGFILGGYFSSLNSDAVDCFQQEALYLPSGTLTGYQFERYRIETGMSSAPLIVFAEKWRFRDSLSNDWSSIRAAGLEIRSEFPGMALLKMTASRLVLGAAYVYDEPYASRWRGYFGLSILP